MNSKMETYKKYGIEFKNGKILSPVGFVGELLKVGNSKTGTLVYAKLIDIVNNQ